MGIGIGILLLVIGLILLFAIKEFPDSLQEVVDPTTVGWILVIAGVLALVLGLVMNNQRSKTTHVRAYVSSSRSRAVSGLGPSISDSAARSGSMTRRPACTRRTASASWRAGVSLTTKPEAPASMARRT